MVGEERRKRYVGAGSSKPGTSSSIELVAAPHFNACDGDMPPSCKIGAVNVFCCSMLLPDTGRYGSRRTQVE